MNYLKTILAILLLLCLFNMPYGYYQFVRFTGMLGFGVLAYNAKEKENKTETVVYIALAILFQPLFKIALGRSLWNIVDVIVAIGLLVSINKDK